MSAKILDGRTVRDATAKKLVEEISKLVKKPNLSIVQVGDLAESNTYIKQKILFGKKIGVVVRHIKFSKNSPEQEIVDKILELNNDKEVTGIIIQLPLPENFDKEKLINLIDGAKDVDGLGGGNFTPATARGVSAILDFYKIPVFGRKITVVGRSKLVGKPIADILQTRGGIINVCHSETKDLAKETRGADILIVAVGKPKLIGRNHVRDRQVVIDVGINEVDGVGEIAKRKIVGDVDFDEIKDVVGAITPVPGGAGPMTVASLFENLMEAYNGQNSLVS